MGQLVESFAPGTTGVDVAGIVDDPIRGRRDRPRQLRARGRRGDRFLAPPTAVPVNLRAARRARHINVVIWDDRVADG